MSIKVAGHTATFSFWNTYRMDEIYTERKEAGEEGLPVLSVSIHSGVSDGELGEEELGKKVKRIEDKTQYRRAMAGDLVFNMMRAWQGAIGVVKTDGMVSPAYIVAKPNDKVYPLFMDYYMKTPRMIETIHRQSYGVTDFRLRLYWDSFAPIRCTLPPIEEQRRIAKILSTQDRVIELYDRKIEQLKRFKKGALSKLFPKPGCNTPEVRFPGFTESWGKYAVRDIASESYSGGTPATGNDTYWNGSIPWIQSSDLTDGKLFYVRSRKHISKEALSDSATQLIPKDSIAIVTRVGVGKLALMPYAYTTSQDFLSLSSLRIEPVFAVYSLYHILQRESSSLQGTSIMGLTKDALLSKLILIPTKQSEQRMIGDYFKNLDYIITLHQRKRDEEIRKKKALMQLLLTGKVRV